MAATNSLSALLSDFGTRVNDMEERLKLMRDRLTILDQTFLKQNQRLVKEVKDINQDISKLRDHIDKIESAVRHVISESQEFAHKEEVAFVEKFIKNWEPMNFATIDDVKEMISKARGKGKISSKDKIIHVED